MMGMDVYGLKPADTKGEYFRNNIWWWRPLAEYVLSAAPLLHNKVGIGGQGWEYNDGDGLNAEDSLALAKILRVDLEEGKTLAYEEARKKKLANLPDQECSICEGTGKREAPPKMGKGTHPCKACDKTGKIEHWARSYPFDMANVEEFAEFLENCGGFKIN
jgi:hypothetical protein|tara:strand:- start:1185 stop:1667 length:483 start_codon:yes stop_codon:yes gene_type:complete